MLEVICLRKAFIMEVNWWGGYSVGVKSTGLPYSCFGDLTVFIIWIGDKVLSKTSYLL